ncbi:RHS repeat protein [Erwinia pyrifoliae]|uniref:RHS repeat-associated core domain-containing protein n=1 Tax=Erwinia pyrifoliae TaxID=79967 RepID=UPI0021D7B87E|nr:RHS repeat-associated core domain-containing protein [Erwinia pyrifoliae]MCU8588627.1 RHS repeat protein [Erwinia pyrifoliae]
MRSNTLYRATPSVTVLDNRGQSVRDIVYHRHPDVPESIDERITRHRYNERGFLAQSADPRLHDAGLANFSYLTDLAGHVLRTQSADAGITVALNDAAGRPFMTVTHIAAGENGLHDRSQSVTHTFRYEQASLPGRPLSTTEQGANGVPRISERFVYAGNTQREKELNLAGQCVGHYDTAGLVQTDSIALSGVPLSVTRRLLKDAHNPDVVADWRGGDASAWNGLLAAGAFTTRSTADAVAAVLTTTDATGHMQRVAYDVAGLLRGSWLTLKGGKEQVIVKSLSWSAAGQKLREEHGNGVVTTYTYEPETQRLTGVRTERPAGHAVVAKVLQDLRYQYDPVGNVLMVRNNAEETRFWRNQKVVPESACAYDSLYQLVSASGREMASGGEQGTNLPLLPSFDSATFTNYTRTYTYDRSGNLTQIRHGAPASGNNYTTRITISNRSNRGVLSTLTENPSEVDALFSAAGQQMQLLPGQRLSWTARGELLQVTPVVRDGAAADGESYRYDGSSQRVLKVGVQKTANGTQNQRVLYLPGVELRTRAGGGTETESLQVITVGEAGRAQVRALHWKSGKPTAVSNNQLRFSYDNLVGSSTLEVDGGGNLISMEEYYPYGGTALWTARSQAEADYKTVRYSGKERDATGLYYYGYRYYQPWAGRWLSVDPAGTVDGLNLFRMVRNNPVTLKDEEGLAPSYLMALPKIVNTYTENNHGEAARIISLPDNNQGRILPSLPTREELGLLDAEVSAVKIYTSYTYKHINSYARGTLGAKEAKQLKEALEQNKFLKKGFIGGEKLSKGIAKFNATLESARKKHPSNESFGSIVTRGIGFDYIGGSEDEINYTTIGSVVEQKSYTSTTVSRPFLNTHLLTLHAHPEADGRWIAPTANFSEEDEVLFAPGTKIIIKDVLEAGKDEGASCIGANLCGNFHISKAVADSPAYKSLEAAHQKKFFYIKKYIYGEIIEP